MGKFYLDNKHKWFRGRAEKAHKKSLAAGGSLASITDKVDGLRFYCKDKSTAPKNIRLIDSGQANVAVAGANGYIGELDGPSSQAARRFFAEYPTFKQFCPAYIVARTPRVNGAKPGRPGSHPSTSCAV